MVTVEIDLTGVSGMPSLHHEFARAMGFPDFYGNNMNAWEDCMGDLSAPGQPGMTRIEVPRGEDLVLLLKGARDLRERAPDVLGALFDSTANVNRVKAKIKGATRLLLLPL
ncbi:MAG: barstar family protein [Dehalococcoidia bacterium]